MQEIGSFILDQLLKMQWLSDLVASMLACFGIDPQSSWGGTLHFFIYDTIKIVILLVTMIFVISYIKAISSRTQPADPQPFPRHPGQCGRGVAGHGDAVLQL